MIKATNKITGKLNASIIHVYPELENIEITPAVEDQEFKSDMYGYDKVRVKGVQSYIDEDIKPEYIKDGVDILGVVGNVIELQGEERTVTPSIQEQVIIPSEDKNGMTKITVKAVDNTIDEDIKPENIIDGVEILGVVGNYKGIDTSDATATAEDIAKDKTAYVNGKKIIGTYETTVVMETELTKGNPIKITSEQGSVKININGKNKFDKNNMTDATWDGGQTSKVRLLSDGTIESTSNLNNWASRAKELFNLKQNTDYTLSGKLISTTANSGAINIIGYKNGTTYRILRRIDITVGENIYMPFNTSDYEKIGVSFNGYSNSGSTYSTIFDKIQIEEGTTATSYSSFKDKEVSDFSLDSGDKFEISLT